MAAKDQDEGQASPRMRWARLRFSIVGQLLACPPEPRELANRLKELAHKPWQHPITGQPLQLSAKSIERMYYSARHKNDPFHALMRKVPKHAGHRPSVSSELTPVIASQYQEHPSWSYQLHYDNLKVVVETAPHNCQLPSYTTVRRFMKDQGWFRQKRQDALSGKGKDTEAGACETRSYEVTHVNALWHYDFHEGSRKVVTPDGQYKTPVLLGILDDCSRVCCHAQWYLDSENTENLVHGLSQAIQKRGLPRATLSDNGGPMRAAEVVEGYERLGIVRNLTQPYSPKQNGKQEHFWTLVEGQLLPMLEGQAELSLDLLNTATQAWVEQKYHHTVHSELKKTPLERYMAGPDVSRESPDSESLRRAFRMEVSRRQRRSDGTVTVMAVRYEVPSAFRTLTKLRIQVARWDLSSVALVDPRTAAHLATLLPLDKAHHASGQRRILPTAVAPLLPAKKASGVAPLLRKLMEDYAATGLPSAYLPKYDSAESQQQQQQEQEEEEST